MRAPRGFWPLLAAQQKGDLNHFFAVVERCRGSVERADSSEYASLRGPWACVLLEDAFERTPSGNLSAAFMFDSAWTKEIPEYMRYRLVAAERGVAGDFAAMRSNLRSARLEVDGVLDRATRRAEGLLEDRVEQRFAQSGAGANVVI